MNLKYYEKLTIAIIIFLGVTIATGYIIGIYFKTTNKDKVGPNTVILGQINNF